jgi:flagellar hook protein FlgE
MSLTSTMYSGLSGLSAMSTSINVTSDNIANLNTVGHRASRAQFETVLSRSIVGVGDLGSGVQVSAIEKLFHQGAIIGSPKSTDMAISGRGFFVVRGTHNGITDSYFSRAGQFSLDRDGFLVNPAGLRVQGYATDASQAISSVLGDLQLNGGPLAPNATTTVSLEAQLNGNPAVVGQVFDPTNPAGTSNWSTTAVIYDSLGTPHSATLYFTRDPANADQWSWNAMVDGAEVVGGTPGAPTSIGSGTLTFANGVLANQVTAANTASFVGAAPNQVIDFDFTGTTARSHPVVNVGEGFDVLGLTQDGFASANLVQLGVGSNGDLLARYDNGVERLLGRVALADFRNENGLASVGGSLFASSAESGNPLIGFGGVGGRGDIQGGALEQSNVDLSTEFVRMITDQRAYQAASRTITTADELLAETVNLKR